MDELVVLFVLILKTLIKIGDFVLLLFGLIGKFILLVFKNIEVLGKSIKMGLKKFIKIPSMNVKKEKVVFKLKKTKTKRKRFALKKRSNFSFSNFFSTLKVKGRKKVLAKSVAPKAKKVKIKKIKKTKAYVPFFLRVRYFFIGLAFSAIFIFLPILFFIFVETLPNPNELSIKEIAQTTKLYDRNGTLLYQIYANQNRTMVPLSSIPKDLKNATIAIEDQDFYRNLGFDLKAIARAFIADVQGEPLQGGSTITQQLVKTSLLTPERSIKRKIKEVILAFWAERIYTKDKILEMYFNQVPYGGTAWGIEAASQTYFGKKVQELSLAESAFLAGMPKAPSIYSPYGEHKDAWRKRQKEVLRRMEEDRYITKEQREKAEKETLEFKPPRTPIYAPHFVMYVKDFLIQKYGLNMVEKGGLKVITSLDLKVQEVAENAVLDEVNRSSSFNLSNGSALVTDPKNGDVIAMVGSKDYNNEKDGNVNLTTSLRQPGSTVKVITYSAALNEGFTAATIIPDTPVSYSYPGGTAYSPVNYDRRYHGNVTLRQALANSINIPAVKALQKVGVEDMVNLGRNMGESSWKDPENYGLSVTLGAAEAKMTEMATVYGTLANKGERVDLNPVLRITDFKGSIIEEKNQVKKRRVLSEEIAFIISDILADNNARSMAFGPNSPLKIGNYKVSVKTGTSDNLRDNWAIGYTPNILVAAWVGNNNNQPMNGIASGITGAAPIWNKIMTLMLNNKQVENTPIPEGIVTKFCSGRIEYFVKGTEKQPCQSGSPSATLNPRRN